MEHYGAHEVTAGLAAAAELFGVGFSEDASVTRGWVTRHAEQLLELDRVDESISLLLPIADHRDYQGTVTLGGLGKAHRMRAEYDTALRYLTRAVRIRERLLPAGDPGLYNLLGLLDLERGDLVAADRT